jgi:lipopolysaccharide biosynthesis protein
MAEITPIKSICFFCSYYTDPTLPEYVKFYLIELKRHFSEVIFLTNEKIILPDDLEFLHSQNISFRIYKNEGYDFGMWCKAFEEYDTENYERIGLINDSCILFKKLDFFFEWLENEDLDYGGMTDCNLVKYHLQSYFIIINKNAIKPVGEYFRQNGIRTGIKEIIHTYEVGLSRYLISLGLELKTYFSFKNEPLNGDPTWIRTRELIKNGMPMIKKKIFARFYGDASWRYMVRFGFDPDPRNYIKLIKKQHPDGDIDKLSSGILINLGLWREFKFYCSIYFVEIYFFFVHRVNKMKRAIVLITGGQ